MNVAAKCLIERNLSSVFMLTATRRLSINRDYSKHCNKSKMLFDELPTEVICKIYSFLQAEDVVRLSLTCKRFHRIIKQDATYWQHACDSLGPSGSVWNDDVVNEEATCKELQQYILLSKTAHNWSKQSFKFFKFPEESSDENMNFTGFMNKNSLWEFSSSGKLHCWNLATREAKEIVNLPTLNDFKVKAILSRDLMILEDEDEDLYTYLVLKHASPQMLFKTKPHRIHDYLRDLTFAGTIDGSAYFWLDEPNTADKACGKISIKKFDGKTHEVIITQVFSYTLRDHVYCKVHRTGRDMDIEVIIKDSWLIFLNGSWPIVATNSKTGQMTHLEAPQDELEIDFQVWNNLLMSTCSTGNCLVIWDVISGKIVYKASGNFVRCSFSTLDCSGSLVTAVCLDINNSGTGYRYNYSIHFYKVVDSELVEDQNRMIILRNIPNIMKTLKALYKRQTLAKYQSRFKNWYEDCPWSILKLKVILNKYLALLFHIDVDDHLNIMLFKLDSLQTPPIIIPLEQGPELGCAYFESENLVLEMFDSTHIIIKFSDSTRMCDPELFYIYDFAP